MTDSNIEQSEPETAAADDGVSPDESEDAASGRRKPIRPLIAGADVVVVAILGILAAVVLSGNIEKFLGFLYSPVIFLLVVTVCVTYLFFKSSDRSRAYKDELELIRGLRRRDAAQRRDLERRLKALGAQCRDAGGGLPPEEARRMGEEIDHLIEELRKN